MSYINRTIERIIDNKFRKSKVLVVTGARQVGKTTVTAVKTTTTANKYLWNYEVTEMTDGTKITSKKHIISTHGATGATGATGNGIKTVTINYAVSTSNTTAPTSGWGTSVPSVAQSSYLWTRTVTAMTDGTSSTSYSVARQG